MEQPTIEQNEQHPSEARPYINAAIAHLTGVAAYCDNVGGRINSWARTTEVYPVLPDVAITCNMLREHSEWSREYASSLKTHGNSLGLASTYLEQAVRYMGASHNIISGWSGFVSPHALDGYDAAIDREATRVTVRAMTELSKMLEGLT